MKDKILYLILGILIGAVITAGTFLVFSKTNTNQMPGDKPDMSDMKDFRGGPNGNSDTNTIPEKPGENSSDTSTDTETN